MDTVLRTAPAVGTAIDKFFIKSGLDKDKGLDYGIDIMKKYTNEASKQMYQLVKEEIKGEEKVK